MSQSSIRSCEEETLGETSGTALTSKKTDEQPFLRRHLQGPRKIARLVAQRFTDLLPKLSLVTPPAAAPVTAMCDTSLAPARGRRDQRRRLIAAVVGGGCPPPTATRGAAAARPTHTRAPQWPARQPAPLRPRLRLLLL